MIWTKATFWLVADTLREALEYHSLDSLEKYEQSQRTVKGVANTFADAFAKSNPRFDREKFIKACGLEG